MSGGTFFRNVPKEICSKLYNITKVVMDILTAMANDRYAVGISAAFKIFPASFNDYSSTDQNFDIWEGNAFFGLSMWRCLNFLKVLFHFLDPVTTRRRRVTPTAAAAHPGSSDQVLFRGLARRQWRSAPHSFPRCSRSHDLAAVSGRRCCLPAR